MNLNDLELKPLTASDFPRLKHFFKNQTHRMCAYALPTILVWTNNCYQPVGTANDDTLVVGCRYDEEHSKNNHLLLPISPQPVCGPERLREIAEKLGVKAFWFVPKDYIDLYGRERIETVFSIENQPHLDDYIYRTGDLAFLKGNKYSKKRNLINQFKRQYLSNGSVEVDRITPEDAPECIDFLDKWCEDRDCSAEDADFDLLCEKEAAVNALENIDAMELRGLMLRLDGEVCAFGIGSYLTDEMGSFMFEKAFSHIKGLYQYFDSQCARQLFGDFEYINKESDLSLPGIAKAKKSYHPVMMMKSYRLNLN